MNTFEENPFDYSITKLPENEYFKISSIDIKDTFYGERLIAYTDDPLSRPILITGYNTDKLLSILKLEELNQACAKYALAIGLIRMQPYFGLLRAYMQFKNMNPEKFPEADELVDKINKCINWDIEDDNKEEKEGKEKINAANSA